jgi:hypothetical protein
MRGTNEKLCVAYLNGAISNFDAQDGDDIDRDRPFTVADRAIPPSVDASPRPNRAS